MQFLFDKHGKALKKGDIVQCKMDSLKGKVIREGANLFIDFQDIPMRFVEVIGNVKDNPELLKS